MVAWLSSFPMDSWKWVDLRIGYKFLSLTRKCLLKLTLESTPNPRYLIFCIVISSKKFGRCDYGIIDGIEDQWYNDIKW